MKKLLIVSLLSLLSSGCGMCLEAVRHVIQTSHVPASQVQAELADPIGTPFPGAYENGPKTIVAEQREAFYGTSGAGYRQASIAQPGDVPARDKISAQYDDAQMLIREKWIRWGFIDGAPKPAVDYRVEELSYDQRRVILEELCRLHGLSAYLTDCASIFEAQCRVESGGCRQNAYNPEVEANARDGLGGSHGWFQIRLKAHNIALDCAYQFRCAAEWTIRYAIANGLKSPPEKGQSLEAARKENLVTALWKHNGATTKKNRTDYLDAFNTRLHEVNGQIIALN